jgi:hypothetical protein
MEVPEHLWRFPTRAAIDSLAKRFGLPNDPGMQDWEIEVADSSRIDEFMQVYEDGNLSDDERFTLMTTIIQSFEETKGDLRADSRWTHVLTLLERDISLHIFSVWYWADSEIGSDSWRVSPFMWKLLERHRSSFVQVPREP